MAMHEDDFNDPMSLDFNMNNTNGVFRWFKLDNTSPEAENFDLLMTSLNLESSINASADSFGIDNQQINSTKNQEGVRVDLVTALMGDSSDLNAISYDGHYSAEMFSFSFVKAQSSKVAGDVYIRVFLADDDNVLTGDNDDVQQILTLDSIKIYDEIGIDVTENFTLSVDQDGGVLIEAVAIKDYTIKVLGSDDIEFNRIEIISPEANALANAGFTVGEFSLTVLDNNEPPPPNDLPVLTGASVNGIVEEEQAEVHGMGNEDTAPLEDQDTEMNFDVTTHVAQGTLTGLVNFGNDAPGTFALGMDTSGLPALTSGGHAVFYGVSGDSLTASIQVDGMDLTVFTLQLANNGDYNFTLLRPLDHDAPVNVSSEENLAGIDFSSMVNATDSNGDSINLGQQQNVFSIDIIDDIPVMDNLARTTTLPNAPEESFNLILVLEFSEHLTADSGLTSLSQWDVIRNAAKEYIEQYNSFSGEVKINIVLFNEGVVGTNAYLSPNDALAFLDDPMSSLQGIPNYDLAFNTAISEFTNAPGKAADPNAVNNITYVLADEATAPLGSEGLDANEQLAYEQFLTTNQITSEVVLVGPNVTLADGEPLAYDGVNSVQINPIQTSFSALEASLASTIPVAEAETITGNLLVDSNSAPGADDGYLSQVEVDGFLYEFILGENGAPNSILTLAPNTTFLFDANTDVLLITTQMGSEFSVNFSNAEYSFQSASGLTENSMEQFQFGLVDLDGDLEVGMLNIDINLGAQSTDPIARDDLVITNIFEPGGVSFEPIEINKTYLTHNDGPKDVTVQDTPTNVSGGVVNLSADSKAFIFVDDSNGGSFTYTLEDDATLAIDTGNVVINRDQSNDTQLDGTGLEDILIGRESSADTLFGYEGDDVLDGGQSGGDSYTGGSGADLFVAENTGVPNSPDVVTDFEVNTDTIGLKNMDLADVSISPDGNGNTLLTDIGTGNVIMSINNINPGDLTDSVVVI